MTRVVFIALLALSCQTRSAAPPAESVVPTGSMTSPRAVHTATRLRDGRVLIAGGCVVEGCESGDASASVEIYDPARGTFSPAGRMLTPRAGGHTATLLADGRVLFAGGWVGKQVTAASEIYDPATGTSKAVGAMTTPRSSATATLLRDGRVLITGGSVEEYQALRSAEIYDPAAGTFRPAGEMTAPRLQHAAAMLADGRVLLAGGAVGSSHGVQTSAEIYDPAARTFQPTGAMTVPRYKHAATTLANGRVLVVGGSNERDWRGRYASAEVYDPATGVFTATGSMRASRFKILDAVALLPGGEVLVGGGDEHVEIYDPAAGAFRTVEGNLGADRQYVTATALTDGRVLIAGGYDPDIHVSDGAWIYERGERTPRLVKSLLPVTRPSPPSWQSPVERHPPPS